MVSPSARLHRSSGLGDPVASHVRFTGLFSRTTTSEDVRESTMVGGTEERI